MIKKNYYILICLLLIQFKILAQSVQTIYPAFVKTEFNRLHLSGDTSAFKDLAKKVNKNREKELGRLNIVHIGGSHVQAGVWSAEFAGNFQKSGMLKGGGYFAFPYRMAKTNGQPYLSSFSNGKWKRCRAISQELCLPLGMSGISICTNDSANNFGVFITDKAVPRYVNVLKVYHNFNSSFSFSLNPADSFKVERKDMPEHGYTRFKFDMPLDSFSFSLKRLDTLQKDFVLFGFSLEDDLTPGVYLAALGLNGASSSSFLRVQGLKEQLATIKADLYVLSLGVNDVQAKSYDNAVYIANYDSLISVLKEASPNAAIILTTTSDNYIKKKTPNKRTAQSKEAMFTLMQKHQAAVWDLYSVMGGYKSIYRWLLAGYAQKDKIHFSNRGYILLGDLMYEALDKTLQQINNTTGK